MNTMYNLVALARRAGDALAELQPRAFRQTEKGPGDFATDGDYLAEGIILPGLGRLFPGINILSEEAGGNFNNLKGLQGIVDPLDGTVNFFFQDEYWSVSIGIWHPQDRKGIGVVYAPRLQSLLFSDGKTAMKVADEKSSVIEVSGQRDFYKARIWMDTGRDLRNYDTLRRLAEKGLMPHMRHSAAIETTRVALGHIDGYYHPCPSPFDVAAAGVIVQAAGGKVTDRDGNPWDPFCGSLVATNGLIHDDFLEVIRE